MEVNGIVSVGTLFHAKYTAEGLYRNNMLHTFISGKEIKNSQIPNSKIITIKLPQIMGAILRKIPIYGECIPYNMVSDSLYDKFALKYINKVDFFIGFNNYSLYQMEILKKLGVKIYLEQRIAHVNEEIKMYERELSKIPNNLSKAMISRKLQEYELADYILVGSEFVKDTFIENGISKNKIIVVPYGYDEKNFYFEQKYKKCTNEFRALFVGIIGFRKGVQYMLEAVKNLANSGVDIKLILVGSIDDSFRNVLNEFKGFFEYKGYLKIDELRKLYNECDVFIFPSLCEGSARVTYEAAACGLPQIVTYNAGSIIEHMTDGIIIEPGSTTDIENALILLKKDRRLLINMRENILKKIQAYTWEKYGENISNVIKATYTL